MNAQKIMRTEGIEANANQTSSEAKGAAPSAAASFQKLMQLSPRAQAKKSGNYLQQKKIKMRMAEKLDRQHQKAMDAAAKEEQEREEAKWSPFDKKDAKFQKKQKNRMSPRGTSKKELKKMLEQEDEITNFSKNHNKVTSAWKRRS